MGLWLTYAPRRQHRNGDHARDVLVVVKAARHDGDLRLGGAGARHGHAGAWHRGAARDLAISVGDAKHGRKGSGVAAVGGDDLAFQSHLIHAHERGRRRSCNT